MIKKSKQKEKGTMKPEVIIEKFGYQYILVECADRHTYHIPPPKMFGMPGMALKAVKKIKKPKTEKV